MARRVHRRRLDKHGGGPLALVRQVIGAALVGLPSITEQTLLVEREGDVSPGLAALLAADGHDLGLLGVRIEGDDVGRMPALDGLDVEVEVGEHAVVDVLQRLDHRDDLRRQNHRVQLLLRLLREAKTTAGTLQKFLKKSSECTRYVNYILVFLASLFVSRWS